MNTGVIRWHISVASHILLLGIVFAGNASGQTYPLLTANAGVQQITAGADGNMWFTESDANKIGKLTPSGQYTEYAVPTPNAGLGPITNGPDGNVWFGEIGKIGKITPDGKITEYAIAGGGPYGLAGGADGNVWFTERLSSGAIGKITPDGKITEYILSGGCCNSRQYRSRFGQELVVHRRGGAVMWERSGRSQLAALSRNSTCLSQVPAVCPWGGSGLARMAICGLWISCGIFGASRRMADSPHFPPILPGI